MSPRTVPFHYGLFWHAMIALLGREPDRSHRYGWDGIYTFRYEPKDDTEKRKFAEACATLQDWLTNFELVPIRSRCEYGRIPHPLENEEGKDYLDIHIVHPVEKKQEER